MVACESVVLATTWKGTKKIYVNQERANSDHLKCAEQGRNKLLQSVLGCTKRIKVSDI